MRVETTYIADDGTTFKTELECEEYEANLRVNKFKDAVILLDYKGAPLPISEIGFMNAHIVLCKTNEAANYVQDEFGDIDHLWLGIEPTAGCWCFYGGRWHPADEILKIADFIKKVMEM